MERCDRDFFSALAAAATACDCGCENETDGRRSMGTGTGGMPAPLSVTLGERCDTASPLAAAEPSSDDDEEEAATIEARRAAGSAAAGERPVLMGVRPDGRRCDAAANPLAVLVAVGSGGAPTSWVPPPTSLISPEDIVIATASCS